MRFFVILLVSVGLSQSALAESTGSGPEQTAGQAGSARTLRFVLYPFIPGFATFAADVKTRFERAHPDIRLEIVDLEDNYYSAFKEKWIGSTKADVYELDSVFLHDFASNKKIQELPAEAPLPADDLLKNAVAGSLVGGKRYGTPHWVCGDFLFFDSSDNKLRGVKTLKKLTAAMGPSPTAPSGLAVDLMGASTLGEFFLSAAFGRYGELERARRQIALYDSAIREDLARVVRLCEAEGCRNGEYHDKPVFAQEFAEKRARAFVGYSEYLNDVLVASADSTKCPSAGGCRVDKDFDVEEVPLDDHGARTISMVDSFTLDKDCTGQCAKDAVALIQFMNADETYLLALLPAGRPPAYLLPAKASLYSNTNLLGKAHLYPKLRAIIETAPVPSALGLSEALRNAGLRLDGDLPHK